MELKLKSHKNNNRDHKINEEIKSSNVRLIDLISKTNEIISLRDAIGRAKSNDEDLIQVSDGDIPVVKIMEYSKFVYQQERAKRDKTQASKKLKQVKFHPTIAANDLGHKIKHIREFIEDNHKVQILCQFKGRENQHKEFGRNLFAKILEQLNTVAKLDSNIQEEGNTIKMTLTKK